MSSIKSYECKICRDLHKMNPKKHLRFVGIRKIVRKHLQEAHNIKGQKNRTGSSKKEFGHSDITQNTISWEDD